MCRTFPEVGCYFLSHRGCFDRKVLQIRFLPRGDRRRKLRTNILLQQIRIDVIKEVTDGQNKRPKELTVIHRINSQDSIHEKEGKMKFFVKIGDGLFLTSQEKPSKKLLLKLLSSWRHVA